MAQSAIAVPKGGRCIGLPRGRPFGDQSVLQIMAAGRVRRDSDEDDVDDFANVAARPVDRGQLSTSQAQ